MREAILFGLMLIGFAIFDLESNAATPSYGDIVIDSQGREHKVLNHASINHVERIIFHNDAISGSRLASEFKMTGKKWAR